MDNRLPLPGKRNSIPCPPPCLVNGLLIFLCLAGITASAETPAEKFFRQRRNETDGRDHLEYTNCLQQDARENLASSPDVRVIAGNAVQSCEPLLTGLQARLKENGVNPGFYMASITRMKNRAIRRLLPLLMMEMSNTTP